MDGEVSPRADGPWIWVGFQVGLGFALGTALVGALFGLAGYALVTHNVSVAMRDVNGTPHKDVPAPTYTYQPTVPAPKAMIHIPPKSKEDCLQQTGQVINDEFAKCAQGYDISQ